MQRVPALGPLRKQTWRFPFQLLMSATRLQWSIKFFTAYYGFLQKMMISDFAILLQVQLPRLQSDLMVKSTFRWILFVGPTSTKLRTNAPEKVCLKFNSLIMTSGSLGLTILWYPLKDDLGFDGYQRRRHIQQSGLELSCWLIMIKLIITICYLRNMIKDTMLIKDIVFIITNLLAPNINRYPRGFLSIHIH